MINNIRKKGRLLTPARKESKSSEVSPDPAAIKQEDTGAQKAKSEVQNKLDMIDRTVDAMVPVLFDKAKDSKVFVPVTRQDVMDALRKLRTAGGAAYKLVSPVEEGSFNDKNGNKKTGDPDVKVEPTGTVDDYPDTIDIVFGGRQTDPYLFDGTTISVYKKNNGIREPVSGITVTDDTGTSNHSDPVNVPVFGSEVVIYVTEFLVKITMTITRKKRVNIVPEDYYEIVPRYIFRTETEYLGDYAPGTVNNNGEGGFIKTPVKEPTSDYQIPKLEVNDMPQDWITEDDYRYAMDIIKISLPNSLAVQEDADMMPSFEGDSVNFGDKVFVGDDETLSYTEDELSKVERKPCRPKINWFLYFLLGVLMSEDETIDMAWVIGHFILCPIQTFFNIYWFLPIKNALKGLGLLMGLIPGVRALLFAIADALPYIYLVEEGMYAIAKKKADTVCRKLVLAKKYSCLLFSEEYFMKGKENDWIAKQIVTEISSEEIDVLRKSTAYQHLVSDDRQKSISLSSLVYNRKNLFKNHEYPEPDAINSAMEHIGEFASVSFDLFMVMGANLTADFASSYKTNNQKEIDRSLKKMCKRLTKVFNMESSNDIAYVVNSIENFRLNTNEYFIYDDTDFPEEYYEKTEE